MTPRDLPPLSSRPGLAVAIYDARHAAMLPGTAIDGDGEGGLKTEFERLTLRWTYRHEMRHSVERCGWTVNYEFGGRHGGPPTCDAELVWGAEEVWVLSAA